ncbi:MAG: hypothetical protein PSV24_15015 [Rhodoferax sp.]|nr:hypothetical protein [Rhodoferax sp.]
MQSIRSEIDAILREEIEQAQKDDPALIVRSAFEVIEDFLRQGMSLERIAAALQKHGIKVTKGHLVRHLGMVREERGLQPLKRGRKTKSTVTVTPAPSTTGRQNQPPPPPVAVIKAAPSPDPSLDDTYPANRKQGTAQRINVSQAPFPDGISKLKFIEVKGELLDVTKMNIDDYLTVSKTIPDGGKIPAGMFEVIAAENRIRGLYERALRQYDEAIAKWKSTQ